MLKNTVSHNSASETAGAAMRLFFNYLHNKAAVVSLNIKSP